MHSAMRCPPWALCVCVAGCGTSTVAPPTETPPRLTNLEILAGQPGGPGWVDGTLVAAHFQEPWAIVGDGATGLYIADGNIIRAIDRAGGSVTTLAGSYGHPGSSDGVGTGATFSLPSGLAFDGGQLYLSDTENHTIRKIDVLSGAVTTIAGAPGQRGTTDGNAADARFGEPEGIALDQSGNLYIADTDDNTIRVLSLGASTVATVAGNNAMVGFADGIGPSALFYKPKALAVDSSGNLYVGDAFNMAVRKVAISTGTVSTLAMFQAVPQGIALDGSDLLVSLSGGGITADSIVRLSLDGTVSTLAGTAQGFVDGVGTQARFNSPAGLWNDGSGTLYIADEENFVLRTMKIADATVETYAGALSIGSSDGTGSQARFSSPSGLANDDSTVYVADTSNDTIRKISLPSGIVTTLAGVLGQPGLVDGSLTDAQFNQPQGLELDDASHQLYVADTHNRQIRRIDLRAGTVSTLLYSSPPGGTFQGFDAPSGLALDQGRLFVTDYTDDVVVAINLQTGKLSELAGTYGTPGSADGIGAGAAFYGPLGVTADGLGHLYVVDDLNDTVREIDIATATVSTLAGQAVTPGSSDGIGAAAHFRSPSYVAADSVGDVFVSDSLNNAIRRIDASSGQVTTIVGGGAAAGVRLGTLPAQLSQPLAITLTPAGGLLIVSENAVLLAH